MAQTAIQQLESCIEKLPQGVLTEVCLRTVIETLRAGDSGQQDLLYLQCSQTSVASQVIGISLVQNGQIVEQHPADPWPYETVLDAMQDGWRVIQFPNLMPDEDRPTGLGCEFILEKRR